MIKRTILCFALFFFFIVVSYSQIDTASMGEYELEQVEIIGKIEARSRAYHKIELDEVEMARYFSFDRLSLKIPAGKLQQNSRGEYHLQLRTLSERQYAIFLDNARQTSLWDNRIDLNAIPSLAVNQVKINRFAPQALWGANNLGTIVRAEIENPDYDDLRQAFVAEYSDNNSHLISYKAGKKIGAFSFLGALAYDNRKEFNMPQEANSPFDDEKRFNSDMRNFAYIVKTNYDAKENFRLIGLLNVSKIEKGVPPEIGVPSPRFWRYPYMNRYYFSLGGENKFPASGIDLNYTVSALNNQQKIRSYKNQKLDVISDEEISGELTYCFDFMANKYFENDYLLKFALNGIFTDRDEKIMKENYRLNEYSQGIYSVGVDLEKYGKDFSINLGIGYDFSDYGKSADKPKRPDDGSISLSFGGAYKISNYQLLDIGIGRKTRFPNLRETFSGALGKFVPNPNLKPEIMNSAVIGHKYLSINFKTNTYVFAYWLKDGIARISLPGGKFKRINKDETLSFGIENISSLIYNPFETKLGICVSGTRAKNSNGEFKDTLEYKPEFVADLELSYRPFSKFAVSSGFKFIYNEYAIDPNVNRFVRLRNNFNLYASANYELSLSKKNKMIFYVEAKNLLDRANYYQFGLPESGRELRAGTYFSF